MAMISFKKGLLANLPSEHVEGRFYITTDEKAMYLDVDGSTRIRLGDFQEFENLAALQDNVNPSTTALYYIKDANILAKWNGEAYVQINPDTGATSIEVTGSGNAVTSASYNPSTRKLTLTMGTTFATPADIDSKISAKVGAIGDGTVKEYVDESVANVVAGSIEGLGALASKDEVSKDDLDGALTAELNGKANVGTASDESSAGTVYGAKKYADEKVASAIGGLDVSDSAVATQFVSAVSETDGKIAVTRRALIADDIPEIAQSKVTGLTGALAGKQDTVVFNTAYNAETNKAATMTDVTNAVAGLSGAMHYVGESSTDPSTSATVGGVDEFKKGDVVTYSAKEYVYDGSSWRELGDEASFAVKGSIKDSDIAADAAISQSKISGLSAALAGKATPADITSAIGELDVSDEAVSGQLVSAVVETDGKIAVSRRALVADDIPTLEIEKVNGLQDALGGVDTKISNAVNALDHTDSAVSTQFVTAVSQTDGVISVVRAQPVISDISGLSDAISGAETNAKEYAEGLLEWGTF